MNYNIGIKTVKEIWVASKKLSVIRSSQMPKLLNKAYDELYNYAHLNNIGVEYYTAMFCYTNPSVFENIDLEAVLILRAPIKSSPEIKVYKVPETLVVSGVHVGSFSDFSNIHVEMSKWLLENNYELCGAYREFYLKHDLRNLADTITEVQYPVKKI